MGLWRGLRAAARQIARTPGLSAAIVATLALCIGANTAIYSVIDAVMLKPLPYPESGRLASLARMVRSARGESVQFNVDGAEWEAVHQGAKRIEAAAYGGSSGVNLWAGGRVEYVEQKRVSAGYFRVLGVAPRLGREFDAAEDTPGGPQVAVLSEHLWQRNFGGDAAIVGRTIELRGEPFTVVGVMPASFVSEERVDLWTPLRPTTTGEGAGTNYGVIARLKQGVKWAEASAEVQAVEQPVLAGEIAGFHGLPPGFRLSMRLDSLQRALTDDVRESLLPLWAAVAAVLLIGCVNIAGLLLAQASVRRREIATRMALGAGQTRIVGQLLAESVLLALGGGAVGLVVARAALEGLKRLGMEGFDLWHPVRLDARVLLVTLGVTLAASVVFGLAPALETTRLDIRAVLLEGGRGTPGRRQRRLRQVLVGAEIALGMALLATAGLLVRTLEYLQGLDPGFDARHVLTAQLSLDDARYRTAASVDGLIRKSLERIRALPGVEAAGVGLSLPYQRPLNDGVRIIDGPRPGEAPTDMIFVSPGYFEALRMRVRSGRTFEERDSAAGEPVAVVNDAFARRYLAGQNPLGRHLEMGKKLAEIVGLAASTPQHSGLFNLGPLAPTPTVYVPFAQAPDAFLPILFTWFSPSWVVRTRGAAPGLTGKMQAAIQAVDPRLPFSSFHSMDELQAGSLAHQRYLATLFSLFAALAVLLAAIGVYGLVANSVTQRTRELGIRMALGATVRNAIAAVVRPNLVLAGGGAALGVLLAWFSSRLMEDLVWGVPPHDPRTLAAAAGMMLALSAMASLLPALRLMRLDPARVLHEQ
jgi:predicted permease